MAHYKGAATEATRAMHIMKRREKAREELEMKKKKVEGDLKLSTIDNKFATHNDAIEAQLRSSTVGLVTLDQMRQRKEDAFKEREKQLALEGAEQERLKIASDETKAVTKKQEISRPTKSLSFGYDDDDDEDNDDDDDDNDDVGEADKDDADNSRDAMREGKNESEESEKSCSRLISTSNSDSGINQDGTQHQARKKAKISLKDLDVDTSFLPDREREEEERRLREKLAAEWRDRQQKLKEEEIEITFSYWDGSGHRRMVRMKKGNSIYQFLQACMEILRKDFNELRSISADQLMYVKEDLIIPHHYTFYDFIVTKARGKSGPLFSFDVHEDVRLIADATVEKDESHAGKVLLRSWYERNKHIFPASRWEPYDPTKTYERYTISDKRAT